ncbi:DsbA family oxidoreductase [Paenibacillus sp. MWE-103]|uniref:DsbA family oxidoreductase n=1 Tax=Paenibacillus artemisiicola TaxID=1172618 RepID=A0ABS3W5D6_9BACL|nr:DsbA family oxidoreductase [Paenibacillus artemisiicola]MBO7743509.1 DsbA family oxidoreductase [Paenibacillus artemisiicola]
MRIDVWSDVMCPLCYIGKTNLDTAIERFDGKAEVEVAYRPFQLFPNAPSGSGKGYYAWTAEIHGGGMTADYVKESNKAVIAMAEAVGLEYRLDTLIPSNTAAALRIALYAQERGSAGAWMARAYKAYFTDSMDIGDPGTLAKLAEESGLDGQAVLHILSGDRYKDAVKQERQRGEKLGISGTPFYVFDDKYAVSGVRSSQAFLEILERVRSEELSLEMLEAGSQDEMQGGACGDNGCAL